MLKRVRVILLLAPAVLLLVGPASALAGPAGTCDNPADSALDQYCPTIPSASGRQQPAVGTRTVAPLLPAAVVHEIARGSRAGRVLLRLPAPVHRESSGRRTSLASTQSLSTWIILILGLLAAALAGGAVAERRRRHNR
jgi:hypothetical protein